MIGSMIQGEMTVIENGVEVVKKISDVESGYYNQADKIVKLLITVVSALGTVMIPRNSYYFANGDLVSAKKNVMIPVFVIECQNIVLQIKIIFKM